jgi:hypothetical protein
MERAARLYAARRTWEVAADRTVEVYEQAMREHGTR